MPTPGLARDGDELDLRLADHALERVLEQAQLAVAADERRRRSRLGVDAEPARRRQRAPGRNGIALALELERRQLLVADRLPRRAIRLLVDDEAADRRLPLQTGGDVDDVAGGDALARPGLGAELDDRLAGRDGGAHRQLEAFLLVQLADRVEDPQPCAHGALRVVLVRHGRAEDRHHRIADELLHGAAEALDLAGDALVVRAERGADVLGVGAVGACREADEVDEEHGDDLALLAARPPARAPCRS